MGSSRGVQGRKSASFGRVFVVERLVRTERVDGARRRVAPLALPLELAHVASARLGRRSAALERSSISYLPRLERRRRSLIVLPGRGRSRARTRRTAGAAAAPSAARPRSVARPIATLGGRVLHDVRLVASGSVARMRRSAPLGPMSRRSARRASASGALGAAVPVSAGRRPGRRGSATRARSGRRAAGHRPCRRHRHER